jgi:hypothetical protein
MKFVLWWFECYMHCILPVPIEYHKFLLLVQCTYQTKAFTNVSCYNNIITFLAYPVKTMVDYIFVFLWYSFSKGWFVVIELSLFVWVLYIQCNTLLAFYRPPSPCKRESLVYDTLPVNWATADGTRRDLTLLPPLAVWDYIASSVQKLFCS